MRFIHMADTHIGYSAYNHIDPRTGRNQREVDVEDAFRQAVDVVLDRKPDFVIHAGDLFHTVRPTNRALSFAMEEISRITEEGIPFIVIAGNHSHPRMRETGSVFRIISRIKGVHAFYRERYETMELGDVMFHLLPHVHGGETFLEQVRLMRPVDGYRNIAVLHTGVEGIRAFKYSTGEANEDLMSINELKDGFDYVAMGHYHEFTKLTERMYYSGSTERLSFSDAGQDKGIIEVELEPFSVKFHKLDIRPMLDLNPIDAKGKSASDIMAEIEERLEIDMEGAIVRLKIDSIDPSEYMALDIKRIRDMASKAMHFEIKLSQISGGSADVDVVNISSIEMDFADFVRKSSVEILDKERLIDIGKRYLQMAKEGRM